MCIPSIRLDESLCLLTVLATELKIEKRRNGDKKPPSLDAKKEKLEMKTMTKVWIDKQTKQLAKWKWKIE